MIKHKSYWRENLLLGQEYRETPEGKEKWEKVRALWDAGNEKAYWEAFREFMTYESAYIAKGLKKIKDEESEEEDS